MLNPGKDKKENVPQLWRIQADRREQVDRCSAGDIIGIVGLRHSVTGDTLCDTQRPDPAGIDRLSRDGDLDGHRAGDLRRAQEAGRRAGDDEAAGPDLPRRENEETGQTLISGMGELHLEVIKHRLLRDFKLNVRVHKPRVSYRETIEQAVEVDRRVPPQHRAGKLSAKVRIRMEPFAKGIQPVTVTNCARPRPAERVPHRRCSKCSSAQGKAAARSASR